MKIKNLLLAILALPLFFVACEPNNPVDEVKDATVAVTAGATTESTIAFTVESTEADPKPFNLKVRLVGMFEAEDVNTAEDKQVLAISTTEIIYPYLRAAVSALTANAFINPMMLPVIPAGTMFPEDRETPAAENLN